MIAMSLRNDSGLAALAHDLLAHLCEELSLNCTQGRVEEEAPLAADMVLRAVKTLSEHGHDVPEAVSKLFGNASGAARH
jgi:hypothetical protein